MKDWHDFTPRLADVFGSCRDLGIRVHSCSTKSQKATMYVTRNMGGEGGGEWFAFRINLRLGHPMLTLTSKGKKPMEVKSLELSHIEKLHEKSLYEVATGVVERMADPGEVLDKLTDAACILMPGDESRKLRREINEAKGSKWHEKRAAIRLMEILLNPQGV